MTLLDATHDPAARSWLASAQAAGCDFPIQNLPFAVLRPRGGGAPWRGAVAIGDQALDLAALAATGLVTGASPTASMRSTNSTRSSRICTISAKRRISMWTR